MKEDCNRGLITEVFSLKLTNKRKLVLLAVIEEVDPVTGLFNAPVSHIAWMVDMSCSQARRYISDLVKLGILVTVQASKGRIPSVFALCLEKGERKQPSTYKRRVDYAQRSTQDGGLDDDATLHSGRRVGNNDPLERRVNAPSQERRVADPSTSSVEECKLLIAAWENAHPDGRRPRYTTTQENMKIAAALVAEGFTIAEVSKLTADKMVGRQTDYKFSFLAEDIRLQRATKPKKPEMFRPDPELDREYTPEELAERQRWFAEGRKKLGFVRKDNQNVA